MTDEIPKDCIIITNADCITKSYPNYVRDMNSLGANIVVIDYDR